jgi:hypothetical protein
MYQPFVKLLSFGGLVYINLYNGVLCGLSNFSNLFHGSWLYDVHFNLVIILDKLVIQKQEVPVNECQVI